MDFLKNIKITPKQVAIIAAVLIPLLIVAGIVGTSYYQALAAGGMP